MSSKNQRSGPKATHTKSCAKGHLLTWVNFAVRGRKNMMAVCECDGYKPIEIEKKQK